MGDCKITSKGAIKLFNAFRTSNAKIRAFDVASKSINDTCIESLGEYIKSNKYIEEIAVSDAKFTDQGLEILAPYLDGNTTLKKLSFDNNLKLTDECIPSLLKMIQSSQIRDIGIEDTEIDQKHLLLAPLIINHFRYGSEYLEIQQE